MVFDNSELENASLPELLKLQSEIPTDTYPEVAAVNYLGQPLGKSGLAHWIHQVYTRNKLKHNLDIPYNSRATETKDEKTGNWRMKTNQELWLTHSEIIWMEVNWWEQHASEMKFNPNFGHFWRALSGGWGSNPQSPPAGRVSFKKKRNSARALDLDGVRG